MKKKKIMSVAGMLLLLVSCGTTNNPTTETPTPTTSIVESTEVALEDQQKPTSTNLEYEDYSMGTKAKFDTSKWYRNDLKDMPLPDPAVIEVGDKYYVYGTTDRTGSKTLDCYETEDFNTYKLFMNIEDTPDNYWGQKILFAPEVYYYDNLYWLYYSDNSKKQGYVILML